jgi:perosamine synthetase
VVVTGTSPAGLASFAARLRQQPPVLSPLSLPALLHALRDGAARDSQAVPELQQLLRRDYAADGVVLTGSGTQALQLAIDAGLHLAGESRIVALPAFSCYDVASAAIGVRGGTRVTFYDLDPVTLAPDPTSLEAAFRRGARAAVMAPLYGMPLPWDRLETLAAEYRAVLVEDAAQGHGATWRERPLGSLGRISVLSFGRGKGWTGGAGGALLWRGVKLPEAVGLDLALRPFRAGTAALVRAAAQWLLARPSLYGLPSALPWLGLGETRYHPPSEPHAMPPAVAALALATRAAAQQEADVRAARAAALHAHIGPLAQTIDVAAQGVPGYLRFPLRLKGRLSTATAVRALRPVGGAPSYPTTLAELGAVRRLLVPGEPAVWPGATTLVRELITLPTHSAVTDEDQDRMVDLLAAMRSLWSTSGG